MLRRVAEAAVGLGLVLGVVLGLSGLFGLGNFVFGNFLSWLFGYPGLFYGALLSGAITIMVAFLITRWLGRLIRLGSEPTG